MRCILHVLFVVCDGFIWVIMVGLGEGGGGGGGRILRGGIEVYC